MKQSVTITGENLNVVMNGTEDAAPKPARIKSKAEMRIETLKAKGIDTSCYFPMGTEQVVKIVDGEAIPVEMMDDTERKMVEGGYINHYTLFRRWVMSQMFHMLRKQEQDGDNFSKLIQDHGYEYSWRVVERELNAQAKMEKHGDKENFEARSRWFNSECVAGMTKHYIESLKKYVEDNLMYRMSKDNARVWKHTCKGTPYVRLGGKNIFIADLGKKVYYPLERLHGEMMYSGDTTSLYKAVVKFNRLRKKMSGKTKMSQRFIDAYKGSGAYFTCKNLIMFHNAHFLRNGIPMTKKQSIKHLNDKAEEYGKSKDGWRMMGVMKQLIEDSNISIQGKIREWSK